MKKQFILFNVSAADFRSGTGHIALCQSSLSILFFDGSCFIHSILGIKSVNKLEAS